MDVDSALLPTPPLVAADVCRGVQRLLWRRGLNALAEVTLPNGRRADLMAIGPDGAIEIVEVKVSLADLRSDAKWPEYLPWCDRFWWAAPADFAGGIAPFEDNRCSPALAGLLVADGFDAVAVRPAATAPLAAARRKTATLLWARLAVARLQLAADPDLARPR